MKKYIFPVFILLGTFLASCSTTVGVKTERPAILDIKDAKSIYIERFLTANEMRHLHSIKTNENDILRNLDSTTNTSARIEDEKEVLALIYWELNKAFEENKKNKTYKQQKRSRHYFERWHYIFKHKYAKRNSNTDR